MQAQAFIGLRQSSQVPGLALTERLIAVAETFLKASLKPCRILLNLSFELYPGASPNGRPKQNGKATLRCMLAVAKKSLTLVDLLFAQACVHAGRQSWPDSLLGY